MIATDCPNCGEQVSTFAKSCAHCGAPNPARRAGLAIVASLAVLLIAVAVATVAILRWQRIPVADAPTPASTEDFGWLTTAMKECDNDATNALSTLYFLVIPLKVV